MPVNPLHAVLEFVCNHDMYDAFHVLSTEHNVEDSIQDNPQLFLLYQITRIKCIIQQHLSNPTDNILDDHLVHLLQAFCNLSPKYQPTIIRKHCIRCNDDDYKWMDISYYSKFYQLHQEIKIQAILTCNRPQYHKSNLINDNLKSRSVDPNSSLISTLNCRHIDISDKTDGDEIALEINEVIMNLKLIIERKNASPDMDRFLENHCWNSFHNQLNEFLNAIKSKYCNTMDFIFNLSRASIQNRNKNVSQNASREDYLRQRYLSEKPKATNTNIANIKKHKMDIDDDHDSVKHGIKSIDDYKQSMTVSVRQKGHNSNEYIWMTGHVKAVNKLRIMVELENGEYRRIKKSEMDKIKMVNCGNDDIDQHIDDKEDSKDSDIEIIEIAKNTNTNKAEDIQSEMIENEEEEEESEDGNEDQYSKMLEIEEKKIKKKGIKKKRKRRDFWTETEDNALKAGIQQNIAILHVRKKGIKGIWWKIKHDPQVQDALTKRTPKQIYDRWRTLDGRGDI